MEKEILLLGNPALYEASRPVVQADKAALPKIIQDMHDTLMAYRTRHGAGRAVAAPQIGVPLRLIYMNVEDEPTVFLNPVLEFPDDELYEVQDDCMSFPGLYVRVQRHKRCVIHYKNESWQPQELHLEGDFAELLQHEYDHLDGILATMRAVDNKAFSIKL